MAQGKRNSIALVLERISSVPTERGCLLWEGGVNKDGYGKVSIGRRTVLAHRLAWAFGPGGSRQGAFPPPEVVIRHRCDEPRCCNPEHLQAGSTADNVRDRDERGRSARGEAHYKAKLTDADVARVRELRAEGLKQREIAALVGCSRSNVSWILRGLSRATKKPLDYNTCGFL